MKNLFLAHTPYHVLLSCGIALDETYKAESQLVIVKDFFYADMIYYSLKSCSNSPFSQIFLLPGIYDKNNSVLQHIVKIVNAKKIYKIIANNCFDNAFVFNDRRPEGQSCLYAVKKNNKLARGIYVEDGINVYASYVLNKHSFISEIMAKVLLGSWWDNVTVLGSSKYVDEVRAVFPEFVRNELRSKHVIQISKKSFLSIKEFDFFDIYLRSCNTCASDFKGIDAIFIVSHSSNIKNKRFYFENLKKAIDVVLSKRLRVAVKYHPRELVDDVLSLSKEVLILPKFIPIEMIFMIIPDEIKVVVGDLTTSVLTAKWLLNNAKVYSLAPLFYYNDIKIFQMFDCIGVKKIENMEDFLIEISYI